MKPHIKKLYDEAFLQGYNDGRAEALEEVGLPDMRKKIEEYIKELDAEIECCEEAHTQTGNMFLMVRIETLKQVSDDLQSRLDELVD